MGNFGEQKWGISTSVINSHCAVAVGLLDQSLAWQAKVAGRFADRVQRHDAALVSRDLGLGRPSVGPSKR